jgi:hypothetical protein
VNDIGNAWDKANGDSAQVDPGSVTAHSVKNERNDGETRDRVSIEILRPWIVITIEVKLEEGGHRPNDDGGEKREVTGVAMSIFHFAI